MLRRIATDPIDYASIAPKSHFDVFQGAMRKITHEPKPVKDAVRIMREGSIANQRRAKTDG